MTRWSSLVALSAMVALLSARPALADGPVMTTYLFNLSTMTGVIPFSGAMLSYDRANKELYVLDGGPIRIFNESGMEIFTFGESADTGAIVGVGVLDDGNLVTLSRFDGRWELLLCNFRGERLASIQPSGIPSEHADFVPTSMRYADGKIYLANLGEMTFLVLDASGKFLQFFDVFPLVDTDEKHPTRTDLGLKNFNVDKDGNILFVIQPLFRAYVLSLAGELKGFGKAGSAPGKFNVVSAIAADDAGNLYVTDILKSAVIVFDKEFRFVREFGYRGSAPQNLSAPIDIAAGQDKIYVSQYGKRGVSVFKIQHDVGEEPTLYRTRRQRM